MPLLAVAPFRGARSPRLRGRLLRVCPPGRSRDRLVSGQMEASFGPPPPPSPTARRPTSASRSRSRPSPRGSSHRLAAHSPRPSTPSAQSIPHLLVATREAPRVKPSVTVVIPTLNASRWLPALLSSLRGQDYEGPMEILVIDSSSDDGTRAILEREAVPHEVISRKEFQHGRTRNRAVSLCRTDLVAFLSQDARPADASWLGKLVTALVETGSVGAYARQIAPIDVHPFQALNLERHMPSGTTQDESPRVQPPLDAATWDDLSPIARLRRIRFDNVSSLVIREFLMTCPFPELEFGEDLTWARNTLLRGRSLAFAPAAKVVHTHGVNH
ncbi:MAG TPA: glycosyltransferase family 2 protein, partial [Planctomycetes bacterium]|nr:glycosyltransferase family 2 protein [Planctomycetota bacterium]